MCSSSVSVDRSTIVDVVDVDVEWRHDGEDILLDGMCLLAEKENVNAVAGMSKFFVDENAAKERTNCLTTMVALMMIELIDSIDGFLVAAK